MIDWGVPSDADTHLSLEHYVCELLHDSVNYIVREHKLNQLHLLGYCMGGTFASLFTALYPERTRSLTLLASPIDFSGRQSLLNVWADPQQFDVDAFVDANGNCPARFLQACFLYIKPVQNILEKKLGFYENMTDREFLINYFALERWVNDNIAVAGETFRTFVKKLYQQNELVRGQLSLGGTRVDLRRISCPLLLLTARHDHHVAPASTEGIRPHVASQDVHAITIEAGHVGLVISGKAQKSVWPQATQWVAERSSPRFEQQLQASTV
jgi:polyhydroxyalkanoate synthase